MKDCTKYYIEFESEKVLFKSENETALFKVTVPAKNLGQAIILAWQMIEKYANNCGSLIDYKVNCRRAEENEEYGWKLEYIKKEE